MAVIPVFISSTFRDFHGERDELVASVLPALDEQVAEYGCRVEMIDLRWGVTAAEGDEQQARVLQVCLEEIKRARPLFLGLLGDRYGWVPEQYRLVIAAQEAGIRDELPNISATALEFEYGALRRPPGESVFLQREVVGAPPPGWRDDDTARVSELTARVGQHCAVHTYHVECDGAEPTDLRGFVKLATDVLGQLVTARARELAGDAPDPVSAAESLFFEDRMRAFDGRTSVLTTAADLVRAGTGVCLSGESGVGKSAIWCATVNRLVADGFRVVAVPVGASPATTTTRSVLRRICDALGSEVPLSFSMEELEEHTRSALSSSAPIVFALDGIDQLPGAPRPTFLANLPDGVTAFVSTTVEEQARYAAAVGLETVDVSPLAPEDARSAVGAICSSVGRTLPPAAVDSLTVGARTPLWLRLAIGEISALDADDFGSVDPTADPLREIARLVTDTVSKLPASTGSLLTRIVDRTNERFGEHDVRAVLSLAAISRSGLRPDDFERLTGLDALTVAGIRRGLSGMLIPRGEDGRLGFAHGLVREYILERFVPADTATALHRQLVDYFADFEAGEPLCQEDRLWHLLRSNGMSAGSILNQVSEDRMPGLAPVILDSLSAPGIGTTLWGLDAAGIHFLTYVVLEHKSAMRSQERIMIGVNVFCEARALVEDNRAEYAVTALRAVAEATSCLADLPNAQEIDLKAAAEEASEFTRGLVAQYPDSREAHEANAQTATFLSREADDEAQALAASRIAVEEWQWVDAREPSLRTRSWLQFALTSCGEKELQHGNYPGARTLYEQALPLTRELVEARGGTAGAKGNVVNALIGLGEVAASEGNHDGVLSYFGEAVELAQSAYVEDPDRSNIETFAQVSRVYGMALSRSGYPEGARDWLVYSDSLFRDLMRVDPQNSNWIFGLNAAGHAAAAEIGLGQVDTARARVRSAIVDAPDSSMAISVVSQSMVDAARRQGRAEDDRFAADIAAEITRLLWDYPDELTGHRCVTWLEAFDLQCQALVGQDDPDTRAKLFQQIVDFREQTLDLDGDYAPLARRIGVSMLTLAAVGEGPRRGQVVDAAADHWQRFLPEDDGEGGKANQWMAQRLSQMALKSPPSANTLLRAALRYAQHLVTSDPENDDYVVDWVGVTEVFGIMLAGSGQIEQAAEILLMAADRISPYTDSTNPRVQGTVRSVAANLHRVALERELDPSVAASCLYRAEHLS